MATITPNTTYPNGATLPTASHNANIYSTTSGRGIMSEPNGGLQVVNLDAAFTIRDEHVMPQEAVMSMMDGTTVPMDVYNNAFGIRDDEDPAYVALAGLCQRVYFPFAATFASWQWSFHVSVFRPFMINMDNQSGPDISPIAVRVFVDGVELPVWRRNFPVSAEIDVLNNTFTNHEQICPLWFDLTYLQQAPAAGYHDIAVKLYLPRVTYNPQGLDPNPDELDIAVPLSVFSPSGTVTDTVQSTVHTRISFGTRNVRCVMFK